MPVKDNFYAALALLRDQRGIIGSDIVLKLTCRLYREARTGMDAKQLRQTWTNANPKTGWQNMTFRFRQEGRKQTLLFDHDDSLKLSYLRAPEMQEHDLPASTLLAIEFESKEYKGDGIFSNGVWHLEIRPTMLKALYDKVAEEEMADEDYDDDDDNDGGEGFDDED